MVQGKEYDIKVIAKNKSGEDTVEKINIKTKEIPELAEGNISFKIEPEGWTNQDVTVTVETEITGYELQLSSSLSGPWETKNTQIFTENGTIYARLWDGTNEGNYASRQITKIDKEAPSANISAGSISDKSVTITASGTDEQSGIKEYEIYINGTKVSSSNTYTLSNMEFYTTYNCYVIVKDQAGNSKQSSSMNLVDYTITTATELKKLATMVNSGVTFEGKTITQVNNIDLGGSSSNQWTPIGTSSTPFKGTYNGNQKTITNIYINNSLNNQGLFGYAKGGEIQHVFLESGTISANTNIGGIVGIVEDGTIIRECYSKATITGNAYVGGICGSSTNGEILAGINMGAVTGQDRVGGIVGCQTIESLVDTCYNTGTITGITTGDYIGGICGLNYIGDNGVVSQIIKSYNKGNVTSVGNNVGGIAGQNSAKIINCYNIARIYSTGIYVAGISGLNYSGTAVIQNCYNAENVSSSSTSYLAPITYNEGGSVSNTYYLSGTCTTSETTIVGTEKSSTELKALAGTLGDAFVTDTSNQNSGYPILSWQ